MAEKEGLFEIEKWLSDRQLPKGKKRKKDYRDRKTEEYVFDDSTLETLYKFVKKGLLTALGGPISRGKESVIFHALGPDDEELAIKMYKINTANFHAMLEYIIGDPRFKRLKRDHRSVIFAWARKEYSNLRRAFDIGVRVPKPIAYERNVLIMEFIGKDGIAAPRLRDIPPDSLAELIELEELFTSIVSAITTLYHEGSMVHADLSEFNIVMDGIVEREFAPEPSVGAPAAIEPVLIDMGQALLLDHPQAEEFLKRDVHNLIVFFSKLGLERTDEEVLQLVRG
jgi:RIO kinase 1